MSPDTNKCLWGVGLAKTRANAKKEKKILPWLRTTDLNRYFSLMLMTRNVTIVTQKAVSWRNTIGMYYTGHSAITSNPPHSPNVRALYYFTDEQPRIWETVSTANSNWKSQELNPGQADSKASIFPISFARWCFSVPRVPNTMMISNSKWCQYLVLSLSFWKQQGSKRFQMTYPKSYINRKCNTLSLLYPNISAITQRLEV